MPGDPALPPGRARPAGTAFTDFPLASDLPWPPVWRIATVGALAPIAPLDRSPTLVAAKGAVAIRDGPRVRATGPHHTAILTMIDLGRGVLHSSGGRDPGMTGRLAAAILEARGDLMAVAVSGYGREGEVLAPLLKAVRGVEGAWIKVEDGLAAIGCGMSIPHACEAWERTIATCPHSQQPIDEDEQGRAPHEDGA